LIFYPDLILSILLLFFLSLEIFCYQELFYWDYSDWRKEILLLSRKLLFHFLLVGFQQEDKEYLPYHTEVDEDLRENNFI